MKRINLLQTSHHFFHRAMIALMSYFFFCAAAQAQTTILNDVNLASEKHKTIIGIFSNYTPKTFPYDQAYGAENFWVKWDILANGNDTYSIHIGGRCLSANNTNGISVADTQSSETDFTLVDRGQGTFYLQSSDGYYLSATGTGFNNLSLDTEQSSDSRW